MHALAKALPAPSKPAPLSVALNALTRARQRVGDFPRVTVDTTAAQAVCSETKNGVQFYELRLQRSGPHAGIAPARVIERGLER